MTEEEALADFARQFITQMQDSGHRTGVVRCAPDIWSEASYEDGEMRWMVNFRMSLSLTKMEAPESYVPFGLATEKVA